MYVQDIAVTRVGEREYKVVECLETINNQARLPHFKVEVVADAGSPGAHAVHRSIIIQLPLDTRKEAEAVWRALVQVAVDAVPATQFPGRS